MKLILEIYFADFLNVKELEYFKIRKEITEETANPDDLVILIIEEDQHKTPKIVEDQYISHSTSWRYDKPDELVIVYLVYSDFMDFEDHQTNRINTEEKNISEGGTKRPRPDVIEEVHILNHAIRHLAFLVQQDKTGKFKSVIESDTEGILHYLYPELAGNSV